MCFSNHFLSGKIGYYQSFDDSKEFEKYTPPNDGWYDYRMCWDEGCWKNWYPYFTLFDCEEKCRTTPECVTATYKKDSKFPGGGKSPRATLHGDCHMNYGTTDIVPDRNDDYTQMTITKRDAGIFE